MMQIDSIVAGTLLALSMASAGFSYTKLASVEEASRSFGPPIQQGTTRVKFEMNSNCIGELTTSLSSDTAKNLSAEGLVDIKSGTTITPATFHLKSHFNPLGQLVESESEFSYGGSFIKLRTQGAHPISILVTGAIGEKKFEKRSSIPGPATLVRSADGNERIEYSPLTTSNFGAVHSLIGGMLQNSGIKIVSGEDGQCARGTAGFEPFDSTKPIPEWITLLSTQLEKTP